MLNVLTLKTGRFRLSWRHISSDCNVTKIHIKFFLILPCISSWIRFPENETLTLNILFAHRLSMHPERLGSLVSIINYCSQELYCNPRWNYPQHLYFASSSFLNPSCKKNSGSKVAKKVRNRCLIIISYPQKLCILI